MLLNLLYVIQVLAIVYFARVAFQSLTVYFIQKLLETNARGERSVEESAHLVGLNLPKKTFHSD